MALLSPKQVEQNYETTTAELARWRRSGIGPEYYRIAPRVVRYGTDDLDEWFSDPLHPHLHDVPMDGAPQPCGTY